MKALKMLMAAHRELTPNRLGIAGHKAHSRFMLV